MKRRLFKISLFLLLGAIISIAVACGCAMWVETPALPGVIRSDGVCWPASTPAGWASRPSRTYTTAVSGRAIVFASGMMASPEEKDSRGYQYAFTTGWPIPCMSNCFSTKVNPDGASNQPNGPFASITPRCWSEGLELSALPKWLHIPPGRILPTIPMWSNLFISSILYGAIVWLPLSLPGLLRRNVRRRKGRCIACGYDLRGTEHRVCPECGQ